MPYRRLLLLALGAEYPDLQKEFPIVALGSVWRDLGGRRLVAYLAYWRSKRSLGLRWVGLDWGGPCRFLAASK